MSNQRHHKHLTFEDRVLLEHYWNDEHLSMSEIAIQMDRNQSTISRELYRGNESDVSDVPKHVLNQYVHDFIKYSAKLAQYRHENQHKRNGPRNLTYDWQTKIELYLNDRDYSPEDFVHQFPECPMSASTIRNYIARGYIKVTESAYGRRSKRYQQKPKYASKNALEESSAKLNAKIERQNQKANHLKAEKVQRLTITERPPSVNNRREFGHWEMDLIVARDGTRFGIMVLVERKTRYMVAVRLGTSRKAEDMKAAFDYFMSIHGQFVKSVTLDNGIEFLSWDYLAHLQQDYGIKMYFAHPNSPQERGTNERRNRDLRHIMGYGNYTRLTQLDWDQACVIANNKPMRIALDGDTPNK
ncbi:IS30 family transposase [Weissella viridescens]|uniref:IS30 family transposase n=1 Tax=Weissella viridescens TaxID=1629 RepID=A0A3P2REP3_WEIVI|nr:IS30 family transposase [Weissella viridescens]RRG17340.1 IS30 family transposase [Weissella viridescens]